MTPEQYMAGVERTLLKNGTLPPLWASALGLAGELGEYIDACYHGTDEECKLELGDVLWYVFAAIRSAGVSLDYVLTAAAAPNTRKTEVVVCEYVDYVKKVCWHDKPIDLLRVEDMLGRVLGRLYNEAHDLKYDLWNEVAVANIEKLKRRYPDGFQVTT